MKRLIFSIVICFLTAASAAAQGSARDRTKISQLLTEFLAAAGRNDAAVHDRFWADELIYTRAAGQRITKVELMQGVRSAIPGKPGDPITVYSAEDLQIHQYGDAVVAAFKLVSTIEKNGTTRVSRFLNTGTFVRRNGKWRVVAWQATAIPEPIFPQP